MYTAILFSVFIQTDNICCLYSPSNPFYMKKQLHLILERFCRSIVDQNKVQLQSINRRSYKLPSPFP